VNDLGIQLLTTGIYNLLASQAGATPDPARGHLALAAIDCNQDQAAGVQFDVSTADASTGQVYIEGQGVSQTATETDANGAGAVFNVPPGPADVSATLASGPTLIGTVNVGIRAGTITYSPVPPTP
jgi:hypothetical protein